MEQGFKYMFCKEGILKLLVIVLSCVTFALLADTRYYRETIRMEWVFAAFIVSCAVSFVFYIFRVTKISNRMGTCGPCSFDGFDFVWSWFCTLWCLSAAIAFAIDFPDNTRRRSSWYAKLVCAVILAFITGIMYAVEAYFLGRYAPARLGYISTRKGWLKTVLVAIGAAAFGLLVDSGYPWRCSNSCEAAITYTLIAFVVGWAVSTIIWILHIAGVIPVNQQTNFRKFEFGWSVICVILFLSGLICFAVFLRNNCREFERSRVCQKRLSSIIIAGVNVVLYIVDAVLNKP